MSPTAPGKACFQLGRVPAHAVLDTQSCERGGLSREGRAQEFRKKPGIITKRKGECLLKKHYRKDTSHLHSLQHEHSRRKWVKAQILTRSEWLKFCIRVSSFPFKGMDILGEGAEDGWPCCGCTAQLRQHASSPGRTPLA